LWQQETRFYRGPLGEIYFPRPGKKIAIFISINTAKRQNKIALFEKRQRIYDDLDDYVNRQLISWEFDLSKIELFYRYSPAHIEALFDSKIKDFRIYLEKVSYQINMLWGDYEYAKNKGNCNGKDEFEIEDEIQNLCDEVTVRFRGLKDKGFPKYFKL
jgi:hypothetical protein